MDIQSHRFEIQASNPLTINGLDQCDESLSDAVQTVFELQTEYALMIWGSRFIPISYKFDLSFMVEDVVEMVGNIVDHESGTYFVDWASNTFAGRWGIAWNKSDVAIQSRWDSVLGGSESLLESNLRVDRLSFVREWKRPLEIVLEALERAGYEDDRIRGLSDLRARTHAINGVGVLYRQSIGG